MPAQPSSKSPAQTDIFGITVLSSSHKDIRRLKRQGNKPVIHGNKSWGASFLLMDYLLENPLPKGSKVLDIGCGWGLASLFCAKQFAAQVTAIDADDSVFPFLQCHAEHNNVAINCEQKRFEELDEPYLQQFDVIIGADICFWDQLAEPVTALIDRACQAEVKTILISDPERPPFFAVADHCMDAFYAELYPHTTTHPRKISGAILIIENA